LISCHDFTDTDKYFTILREGKVFYTKKKYYLVKTHYCHKLGMQLRGYP
jgi:hypothetical protein